MKVLDYLKYFSVSFFIVITFPCCKNVDEKIYEANKLFEKNIQSKIPSTVRVFDAKSVNVSSSERTIWVAFDCSQTFWEDYSKSLALKEISYYLSVLGGNVADTGFEGYLDDSYTTYGNRKTKKGIFLTRKMSNGILRIVFLYRGA